MHKSKMTGRLVGNYRPITHRAFLNIYRRKVDKIAENYLREQEEIRKKLYEEDPEFAKLLYENERL